MSVSSPPPLSLGPTLFTLPADAPLSQRLIHAAATNDLEEVKQICTSVALLSTPQSQQQEMLGEALNAAAARSAISVISYLTNSMLFISIPERYLEQALMTAAKMPDENEDLEANSTTQFSRRPYETTLNHLLTSSRAPQLLRHADKAVQAAAQEGLSYIVMTLIDFARRHDRHISTQVLGQALALVDSRFQERIQEDLSNARWANTVLRRNTPPPTPSSSEESDLSARLSEDEEIFHFSP